MNASFFKISKVVVTIFQVILLVTGIVGIWIMLSTDNKGTYRIGPWNLNQEITLNSGQDAFKIDPDHFEVKARQVYLETSTELIPKGWTALLLAIAIIMGVWILQQLKEMIISVIDRNPFTRKNVWRIYIIATMFFIAPLILWLVETMMISWLYNNYEMEGIGFTTSQSSFGLWYLPGLFLITIGKIFSESLRIKEENELTV